MREGWRLAGCERSPERPLRKHAAVVTDQEKKSAWIVHVICELLNGRGAEIRDIPPTVARGCIDMIVHVGLPSDLDRQVQKRTGPATDEYFTDYLTARAFSCAPTECGAGELSLSRNWIAALSGRNVRSRATATFRF